MRYRQFIIGVSSKVSLVALFGCLIALLMCLLASRSALAAEGGHSWFKPFAWQETPEPGQTPSVPATEVPASWNMFKWSNDPQANVPKANTTRQTAVANSPAKAQPLHTLPVLAPESAAVFASDMGAPTTLKQPTSLGASQKPLPQVSPGQPYPSTAQVAAYQNEPVEWPAEREQPQQGAASQSAASQSAASQSAGQGTNPFEWTNTGPAVQQSVQPPQNAPALQRAQEPWQWSNDRAGRPKPRDITPPEEPSFSSAVMGALTWSDQPEGTTPTNAELGRPPEDATEEQLVEWERNKYPWIRPFYWSNENPELALGDEIAPPDPTKNPNYVPLMAKPFTWENRHADGGPQRLPAQHNLQGSYPTTQAAAFFQTDEQLPTPKEDLSTFPGFSLGEGDAKQAANDDQQDGEEAEASDDQLDTEKKGALAEAESLGEEPEDNSLQFLRADTVLLDPGQFQFDYGVTYTKFDLPVPVVLSTPSGNVVELAQFRAREMRLPFEIRYGLARRVQLFVNVPFGWANTEFSLSGLEAFENDGGIGDVIFGGSFLLRDNDPCDKPDMILTLAASAPTGKSPFQAIGTSTAVPTLGSGAWSLASNLLWIKNYDPVTVFYGLGTRQHFDADFNGQDLRRGGEYNYQFGVGFGVNSKVTFSTRFNGAYLTETRLDGQRIPGTIQEPMALSMAMTIAKNKKLIEPFVDFGLTDDASDVRIGITWTR